MSYCQITVTMSAVPCRAVFSSKMACPLKRRPLVVAHAEPTDRRAALFGLASVAALVAGKPAEAAYGEAANIFGKPTTTSGFIPYDGDGFALLLPSKYNPDKEKPFPGTVLRYVDFYPVNSLTVLKVPASKASVDGYGTPEAFLTELQNMGIFGKQAYTGSSRSEGGFAEGRYAAASLLDTSVVTDKKGKKYYQYEVLVRSADGNEGGRNETIKAAVGRDNQLYILINQIGDKRTVVGKKNVIGSTDSFSVA